MPVPTHLGDAPYPSPSKAPLPRGRHTTTQLSLPDLEYLRAYIEITQRYPDLPERQAELQALTDAGFETADKTPNQLRKMRYDILQRIDHALDVRSALEQAGMGKAAWVRLIYRMSEQPEWKYRAVAAKYWGLGLGLFSAQPQGEGAAILIGAKTEGAGVQVQAAVRWPSRAVPDDYPAARAAAEAHYRDVRLTLESAKGGADKAPNDDVPGP